MQMGDLKHVPRYFIKLLQFMIWLNQAVVHFMLLKSFVALTLIPELDLEIGITVLCSEISDQSDEFPLFDYVDYFESTWVGTILPVGRGVGLIPISPWNQFEEAKNENRKPIIRWRDGIERSRWGWGVLT